MDLNYSIKVICTVNFCKKWKFPLRVKKKPIEVLYLSTNCGNNRLLAQFVEHYISSRTEIQGPWFDSQGDIKSNIVHIIAHYQPETPITGSVPI